METISIHLAAAIQCLQGTWLLLSGIVLMNNTVTVLEKFFPKHLACISFFTYLELTSWNYPFMITKEQEFSDVSVTEKETTVKQEIGITREEMGFIMSKIGISLSQEDDQISDYMSDEEFSTLFEQIEPGLQEVKDAFSIFDQNGDGFIDAKELQTVLINLGLREGASLNACQSMIEQHDRNHDGKIDQSDFYKLLESSLL